MNSQEQLLQQQQILLIPGLTYDRMTSERVRDVLLEVNDPWTVYPKLPREAWTALSHQDLSAVLRHSREFRGPDAASVAALLWQEAHPEAKPLEKDFPAIYKGAPGTLVAHWVAKGNKHAARAVKKLWNWWRQVKSFAR